MKRTSRPVKCTKVLGNRGTGTIHDSCRFDIGRFRAEPTNYERRLHPSDTFAYRGAHNYWFITLRVIHKLKTGAMTNAVRITAQPTGKAFRDNTEHVN